MSLLIKLKKLLNKNKSLILNLKVITKMLDVAMSKLNDEIEMTIKLINMEIIYQIKQVEVKYLLSLLLILPTHTM